LKNRKRRKNTFISLLFFLLFLHAEGTLFPTFISCFLCAPLPYFLVLPLVALIPHARYYHNLILTLLSSFFTFLSLIPYYHHPFTGPLRAWRHFAGVPAHSR
jgi:hypothetical protein